MTTLEIKVIPCLEDNYAYLLRDRQSKKTAVIDPSEAKPVLQVLSDSGWKLDYVLNTHHHWDHVGGNLDLKGKTGCQIVGSAIDKARIPGIDLALKDGDEFALGESKAKAILTKGHTQGQISFWFAQANAVFTGDTLFLMGCGRLFEGTPADMWESMKKLRALPKDTNVYCGHEYTLSNGNFALSLERDNPTIQSRMKQVRALREKLQSTVPATMAEETATNPFMRADQSSVAAAVGLSEADPITVLAELRRRKDHFQG